MGRGTGEEEEREGGKERRAAMEESRWEKVEGEKKGGMQKAKWEEEWRNMGMLTYPYMIKEK